MPDIKLLTDEELVVEIRTKNKEQYADLVKRYQEKLLRYAVYLIHDQPKAVDVVQETFIKAYINLNGFDAKKKFGSWIYRILHNTAMNSVKKYSREIPLIQEIDYKSDVDLEHEYSKNEIIEKVRKCLDQMPIIYGEPLALYYLEDKSYEEISDILRIPMGTVATRINRARGIMKTLCQKHN
jgi:RNA polymerase sigma-70 factor, ECF subfamily